MNDNTKPTSWRDVIKVHPAADLFPLMPPDELKALGEDIKKNGLRSKITLFVPKESNKEFEHHFLSTKTWAENLDLLYLLDGRNRLDAFERQGGKVVDEKGALNPDFIPAIEFVFENWRVPATTYGYSTDAYGYVLSLNIHRRHLTAEQKRDIIAAMLKAQPSKSNREIARQVKDDHHKVGAVRRELEATGENSPVEKTIGADGKARTTKPKTAASRAASSPAHQPPTKTQRAPKATVPTRDDIGPDSQGEVARLQARVEELTRQLAMKDQRIAALEREVAEGERRIRELTRQLPAANEQPAPDDGDGIPDFLRRPS